MTRLVVLGGGRMGEALVRGLLDSSWAPPSELVVIEPSYPRREELAARLDGVRVVDQPVAAEGAVLATKPTDVATAAKVLGRLGASAPPRVLSIAAGITLAALESWLPPGTAVVRAMPNTPALVGAGVAAIAAGQRADEEVMGWARSVLAAVGQVVTVPESSLDAVTGLSGSGPAYVFLVAEALIEAGVLAGLPRDVASRLTTGTLLGAARLLAETNQGPAELRAAVTSPGGTTAVGLRELEDAGVRAAFLAAVSAATERSRELGRAG